MLLGAAKVTAPLAAHAAGRDIWGQQKLQEGGRRRAGCVSAGEGDNLCPGQLFPPSTSFLPLPGQWVKAAAAVGWEQEQLSVPVAPHPQGRASPRALERAGFGAAEPGEQLCSQCCCFGTALSQNFVSASVVTSQERNGKSSALLCLLEIQASALQMP